MIRHLFTLVWNRKRQNFLLLVELFFAYLVVVGVAVLGLHIVNNVRQPLGFSYDRLWSVTVSRGHALIDGETTKAQAFDTLRQLSAVILDMPEVEASSQAWMGPYSNGSWGQGHRMPDGRTVEYTANRAADAFADVTGVRMLAGRWFNREDEGATWEPVVLNQQLAVAFFGRGNPIGQIVPQQAETQPRPPGAPPAMSKRVVGVVEDFRQFGEMSTPTPLMFYRLPSDTPTTNAQLPETLLLRVRPGTTAAFEETLARRLEATAPGWSFSIDPVPALREQMNRQFSIPLVIFALVAAALLLMVALGLTGVVWQGVTQRTREFGLRRANGATAGDVRALVLGELVMMTTFAVSLGVALISQLALLPLPSDIAVIPRSVAASGVALAALAVYLVVVVSGWYPSRLASQTPPAEALHYE